MELLLRSSIVILACSTDLLDALTAQFAIIVWRGLITTAPGLGSALDW